MKNERGESLRTGLTRSIIIMQTVVLMVFTAVAAVPVMQLVSVGQTLDERVVSEVSESIEREPDSSLVFTPNRDLQRIISAYPKFWFYATDADGKSVQFGAVPAQLLDIAPHFSRITTANISDIGSPDTPAVIIRQHAGPAGNLWIGTAGGPQFTSPKLIVVFLNPFFLGLLFFFVVATLLVIPFVVRRQLRGLEKVAQQAGTIDVDQRGIRLPVLNVPRELHPLVGAVNDGLARLDQGIDRQQRFMADAAHELRTPIAILQTRLEALPDSQDRRVLMLDVARLGSLANQLLDLQRMTLSPEPFGPVDLVALAAEVSSDLAPLVIAAADELEFEHEADAVIVAGDRGALSRAITNLVQNAIAHGGPRITITVSVFRDGRVTIADNGLGIAPEHRNEVFEPFHRVSPLQYGAGLGLNLVESIVARHNGRVSVRETEGGGTTFEISLPLAGS